MKVLVTAASRHGTTAEIAQVIGDVLKDARFDVEILPPEAVVTIDGYDAIVIGSGVYAGHWLEPAKAFVARHESAFADRPVFLFSSGPLGDPPKPAGEPVDVRAIELATNAIDHRVFPGRLARSEMSLPEKVIVAAVRAPYGDYRPWDDILAWAGEIVRILEPMAPTAPSVAAG